MNSFPSLQPITLAARALHTLDDAAPAQLTCQSGSVWITLDNDPRDIVLEPGQSFSLPGDRRAIVYALEASSLTLRALPVAVPVPAASARPAAVPVRGLQAA